LEKSEETKDKIQKELLSLEMEQFQINNWANFIQSSDFDGLNDEFSSDDDIWSMKGKQKMIHRRSYKIWKTRLKN
jgi:hypothetical protein